MSKEAIRGSVRQTREANKRAIEVVHEEHEESWLRGASLEMPEARPGMDQRWIRVAMGGKDDATNWARKQREGWRPRKADTVPEDFPIPRIDHGKMAGYIGIEGMVLCERPVAISERRNRHFRNETQRRTEAINYDLEKINTENRNPAFGPIRMATRSTPAREVAIQRGSGDED